MAMTMWPTETPPTTASGGGVRRPRAGRRKRRRGGAPPTTTSTIGATAALACALALAATGRIGGVAEAFSAAPRSGARLTATNGLAALPPPSSTLLSSRRRSRRPSNLWSSSSSSRFGIFGAGIGSGVDRGRVAGALFMAPGEGSDEGGDVVWEEDDEDEEEDFGDEEEEEGEEVFGEDEPEEDEEDAETEEEVVEEDAADEEEEYEDDYEEGEYEDAEGEWEEEEDDDIEEERVSFMDALTSFEVASEETPVDWAADADADADADPAAATNDDEEEEDPYYKMTKEAMSTTLDRGREAEALKQADDAMYPDYVPSDLTDVESIEQLMNYVQSDDMTDEVRQQLNADPDIRRSEQLAADNPDAFLTADDLKDLIVEDEDGNEIISPDAIREAGTFADMRGHDAFPDDIAKTGMGKDDLVEMDDLLTNFKKSKDEFEEGTFYGEDHDFAYMDVEKEWELLDEETQEEIMDVIEGSDTMACPDPEMWLLYDLKFNVTNLILSAFKHNREAPIIFSQWWPQLEIYDRYTYAVERDFEWTWDDVENADMTELFRYYKGIGYDEIPLKNPGETGAITLDESPMDDEEREMAALENWMDDVFDEVSENLLFDDEKFEPKDNVFDATFAKADRPDVPKLDKFQKDFDFFEQENAEETQEWRDQFATLKNFTKGGDDSSIEGPETYRGHLVVACTEHDDDLDIAEKITARMGVEFPQQIFVETRVLAHARASDNVFEVWLESYDIDLLHSKRQAFINSKIWLGPSIFDDEQLDVLVDTVKDLISEEGRYSYRYDDYCDVKA